MIRMTSREAAKLPPESEDSLKRNVLELAKHMGWLRAHFRPARTVNGWRTAVEADGKGFPDLVLLRPPRLIFAELKREDGKVSDDQKVWLALLAGVLDIEVYTWRPSDWENIKAILERP